MQNVRKGGKDLKEDMRNEGRAECWESGRRKGRRQESLKGKGEQKGKEKWS